MSVVGEAHQTFIESLELTRSRAVDPRGARAMEEEKEKEEHRTTKNCWVDEKGQQQQQHQRRQQVVNENGEEEERGPSLEDVKRALRQNFHDTGVVDDVTVRTAFCFIAFCTDGGIF